MSRSRKFWKGRSWSRIFYLRLRNPANCNGNKRIKWHWVQPASKTSNPRLSKQGQVVSMQDTFIKLGRTKPSTEPHAARAPRVGHSCPSGYTHGKAAQRLIKDQVLWLYFRPILVPNWCGASRTVRDCWKPWESPPTAAAPATLSIGKPGVKMNNEWKIAL